MELISVKQRSLSKWIFPEKVIDRCFGNKKLKNQSFQFFDSLRRIQPIAL
jgi:hypothetical protein